MGLFSKVLDAFKQAPGIIAGGLSLTTRSTAEQVKQIAEAKFGIYQQAVGPYPAWQQLAESTLKKKTYYGAEGDEPLIGAAPNKIWPVALKDTIEVTGSGLRATVGSADPLMAIHEFGVATESRTIPPRPVLFPAAYEVSGNMRDSAFKAVQRGFGGKSP